MYIYAEFKYEMEEFNRANYNSTMLCMIAQPTRKNPETLPMYKSLYEAEKGKANQGKMTGEEILAGLMGNGVEAL